MSSNSDQGQNHTGEMPFGISAEQWQHEAQQAGQRAGDLLAALADIRDVEVGTAPRELVYSEDKVRLYRYRTEAGDFPSGPAVLISYALVNRPYMLDLQPDRSFIRGLVAQGLDVFLVDWGYPDGADRYLELEDYLQRYLLHCVQQVCTLRNEQQVNLIGVCQGGTFSTIFTALHPDKVAKLITMVTPIDFQTEHDLLSKWARALDVNTLVNVSGNVPGSVLNSAFLMLMPFRLLSQKYVSLLDMAGDRAKLENFMRMEKWIFDSPDQPGALFNQFVTKLYQQNQLMQGTLDIGRQRVDLKRITQPVLNIYATQDHLVPPAASRAMQKVVGSKQYLELAVPAGHIGIYTSSKAQQLPSAIRKWLSG